ncbi:MAG TPA: hypothetical protein DCL38_05055 [Lachnospiraceae bacterium]|nr:hypothetical protein [Lachnospiraceae bacterium]
MKKICIQCGKEFELTDSEVSFFEGKGLELPKRCSDCRKTNKKNRSRKYHGNKNRNGNFDRPYNERGDKEKETVYAQGSDGKENRADTFNFEEAGKESAKKGFLEGFLDGIKALFSSGKK